MPELTVCPNCEQWQRPPYGDCTNECAKRGFAPYGVSAEVRAGRAAEAERTRPRPLPPNPPYGKR